MHWGVELAASLCFLFGGGVILCHCAPPPCQPGSRWVCSWGSPHSALGDLLTGGYFRELPTGPQVSVQGGSRAGGGSGHPERGWGGLQGSGESGQLHTVSAFEGRLRVCVTMHHSYGDRQGPRQQGSRCVWVGGVHDVCVCVRGGGGGGASAGSGPL